MMKRMMFWGKLKPERVEEYKEYHRHVWPELLAAYRQAGITKVSCFLHGVDLLVYSEYDDAVYPQAKAALARNEVEIRWQALMGELRDPAAASVEFAEVFHMGEHS